LLCRNKFISEGVNRSETRDVLGFVGGKCSWLDAEDFCEFIIKPLLDSLCLRRSNIDQAFHYKWFSSKSAKLP
jgi:hypothetical protein